MPIAAVPQAAGSPSAGVGAGPTAESFVRLTDQRFTCAAKARVPKPTRRTACLHVSRAMQAARRLPGFDFPRRLGRRTEAGPRRVLPRVGPRLLNGEFVQKFFDIFRDRHEDKP